ncbi:helix-turn-helix transcriptional regulator [uncultured Thiodictyon sp.]|uniref:helix-turn-helix domain-containing protein n=1 Tax=uncultured Thiodictyon sp. TaxID=1846217 RepID=UPI0025E92447|nr:helix-turn-helix transcriptional regulator [uncultured Thiodictyon sp.]
MNEDNVVVLNGERLKRARIVAGLNQAELAQRCGVSQSHISGMERSVRAPSIEMLDTLAQTLGVSAHWLMGGDSDETLANTEIGREHILAERKTPVGLASLAGDTCLCEQLHIRSIEWRALRSLQPPNGLNKEGYLLVLLALRGHQAT